MRVFDSFRENWTEGDIYIGPGDTPAWYKDM